MAKLRDIDIVGWNRDLGEVIEEIVEQNLRRKHGQKGQEQHAGGHAEHVAEIGARAHQQVFHDIGECLATFHDTLVQYRQAPLAQHDVSSISCYVDSISDRYADISGM